MLLLMVDWNGLVFPVIDAVTTTVCEATQGFYPP